MIQKRIVFLVVLVLTIITSGCYVSKRLPVATGYSAKYLCSSYFVSHRSKDSIENADLNFSIIKYAHNKINEQEKSVTSKVLGMAKAKAIYIDGRGCVLVKGKSEKEIRKINTPITTNSPNQNDKSALFPYGDKVESQIPQNVDKAKLEIAVNKAFDDSKREKKRNTRAVVVVYDNQIIAEKYAKGFHKDMPLLGWSMSKSITNALTGILVKQGKLDINRPVDIKEWQNDSRKQITLNNLLQMSSGLEWNEGYGSLTDVVKMLYKSGDFYQYTINKPMQVKPDSIWYYSSGTTNIVTGIIRKTFVTEKDYIEFPKKALFDKIGMQSAVFEPDASGNYVGSSYVYATPRDWARFGLLYLNNGNWNGEQLFPEGWVEYTKTPNLKSNGLYGAFFWLNKSKILPDVPDDAYACYGFQEQRVFIIPSKKLVVVRMGLCDSGDFDFNEFLADIIKAIPSN